MASLAAVAGAIPPVPLLRCSIDSLWQMSNSLHGLRANRGALEVLGIRCGIFIKACCERLQAGNAADIERSIQAVRALLDDVHRFVQKLAAKNSLRQLLGFLAACAKVEQFDDQLTSFVQSLQLPIAFDRRIIASAIQQDESGIPALLELLCIEPDVTSQSLETLVDIDKCFKSGLAGFPPHLQTKARNMLMTSRDNIIRRCGRNIATSVATSKVQPLDPDMVDILHNERLGKGSLGSTFKAIVSGRKAVAKVIYGVEGRPMVTAIEKLAEIWAPLRHAHILHMWGVCLFADNPFIITPLMQCDLRTYLQRRLETDIDARAGFVAGIAKGMRYLHEQPDQILHGNLNARNVLIDILEQITSATRWLAPEMYKRGYKPAPSADVFAFGMTCYEIFTGRVPFFEEIHDSIVQPWIQSGERPDRPEGVPSLLWEMMQKCWHQDPGQRPTFAEIDEQLTLVGYFNAPFAIEGPRTLSIADTDSVSVVHEMMKRVTMTDMRPMSPMSPMQLQLQMPMPTPLSPLTTAQGLQRLRLRKDSESSNMDSPPLTPPRQQIHIADIKVLVKAFPDWAFSNGVQPDTVVHPSYSVENGRLKTLNLKGYCITASVPTTIFRLNALVELDLSNNMLFGSIPDTLGSLEMLEKLSMKDNKLTGSIPKQIGFLVNLRVLDLSSNRLTGAIPHELGALINLETLNLSQNRLTCINHKINQISEKLAFSSAPVVDTLPTELTNLLSLTELDLSGNQLFGTIHSDFAKLQSLVSV
ncbi:kinase-like domain-containing protein [Entophlyctis helioformis]|nr:kinase-like domain-containing protein [Entophlyctis helioformis]